MPGNTGAQCDRALEALAGGLRCCARLSSENVRIQYEQHARLILASELANHQRAQPRGSFPMNMARAVRGDVITQRIEILAAALCEAFHRTLQARQDFEKFARRLGRRIDQSFRAQIDAMCLLQKAKREACDDAESLLPVNPACRKGDGNGLMRA